MTTRDLIEEMVKSIVNSPDKVSVARTVDEMGVLMAIDIEQKDAPLLIGKQGKTINALRTIARIAGIKNKEKINIKINEPWNEKI